MTPYDQNVLTDRVLLAAQEPAAAHLWHRIYHSSRHAPAEHLNAAVAYLRTHVAPTGLGGFLAASCLHSLTAEVTELASAARVFNASTLPSDAGLALLHLVYSSALASGGGTAAMETMVCASGFLDVVLNLGRRQMRWLKERPRSVAAAQGRLRKVAVFSPTLSSGWHAPTRLAIEHANRLQDGGLEVAVFSTQEFQMLDMSLWLGVPRRMSLDDADAKAWPRPKNKMSVTLASTQLSMDARWSGQLQAIDVFDPDVVLFIGPYSPLLVALHHRYPVVGLGINALAPIGSVDVWLAPGQAANYAWGPTFSASRRVSYSHRFSVAVAPSARQRDSLGLPEGAVVCVTTGSRLADEILPGWRDRVLQALERHPNCHWLVVGMSQELMASHPIDHPRVHLRGFDPDLPSLLKACDLYLNPPRLGAGYSVLMAMAQGTAVLSMTGSDGGDKLGPWAHADESLYFAELETLLQDRALLRQRGSLMAQRYLEIFDLGRGDACLVEALQSAVGRDPR